MDQYLFVQRKKGQLLKQHRKNEIKIFKLLEDNSRINQEIYTLINAMDAVHRERQRLTEVKQQ